MIETIGAALGPLERVLFQRDVAEIALELREAEGDAIASGIARRYTGDLRRSLEEIEACMALLRRSQDERHGLEARFAALAESLAAAESQAERNGLMLEFLALITPRERLKGDAAAFRRYMGLDCVTERYQRVIERKYMREEILVKTLGLLVPRVVVAIERDASATARSEQSTGAIDQGAVTRVDGDDLAESISEPAARGGAERAQALLRELGVESFLLAQVRDARRWQNRVAAFRTFGKIAASLPASERARFLSVEASNFLMRCCLDGDENVWIQRVALELLCEVSPREGYRILERRLLVSDNTGRDDFFARGHAVSLLPRVAQESQWLETVRRLLRRPEPSEYVRMAIVRVLASARTPDAERLLLELVRGEGDRRDPSPRVRAEAAIEWRKKAERDPSREEIAARVLAWLIRHDDAFLVRRIALEEAAALGTLRQRRSRKFKIDRIDQILLEATDDVARGEPSIALKRLAEETREAIIVRNLPAFDWVEGKIAAPLSELDETGELRVPRRDFAVPEDLLGRILAYFTRDDFGLVVERGRDAYTIRKGDRRARRLWRILHELRNPDTAKRQAYRHTTGRIYRGEIRAHPGMLAELMETKVPGERLWNEAEQSWRRFLPLVDDYLSLFSWLPWRRQRVVRVFSSQGVTEIRDTNGFFRGLGRYLKMCWRYALLAGQRNAHERNKVFSDPSRFVRILREEYGIETRFRPADYTYEGRTYVLDDPSLALHFKFGAPPPEEREADTVRTPAPARSAALGAEPGDKTPAAPGAERAPAEAAETPVVAGADDPHREPEPDSIDSLIRPLEELARAEGPWLEAAEAPEGGALAAATGGGTRSTGISGSVSSAEAEEDTHDELVGPIAGEGSEPALAAPGAALSDETLPEIPLAPVAPDRAAETPAAGVALGDSAESPAERGALDVSTADIAESGDVAGEITPAGALGVTPLGFRTTETPTDGIPPSEAETGDDLEEPAATPREAETADDIDDPAATPREGAAGGGKGVRP